MPTKVHPVIERGATIAHDRDDGNNPMGPGVGGREQGQERRRKDGGL